MILYMYIMLDHVDRGNLLTCRWMFWDVGFHQCSPANLLTNYSIPYHSKIWGAVWVEIHVGGTHFHNVSLQHVFLPKRHPIFLNGMELYTYIMIILILYHVILVKCHYTLYHVINIITLGIIYDGCNSQPCFSLKKGASRPMLLGAPAQVPEPCVSALTCSPSRIIHVTQDASKSHTNSRSIFFDWQ